MSFPAHGDRIRRRHSLPDAPHHARKRTTAAASAVHAVNVTRAHRRAIVIRL